jgi:hypothetical protein
MANLRKWSTSASGNSSVAGGANTINYAEGQAPGSVNNSAREVMAQIRSVYVPQEWGWVEHSATASVASQTVFKLAGDQTTNWTANRRWRLKSASTTRYGKIVSSSFTAETTVTVEVDSGSLSASHSLAALSAIDGNHVPASYVTSSSLTTALGSYISSNSLSAGKATAANYLANDADKILVTDKIWTAAGTVALTWNAASTSTVDFSTGINFTVTTATGNSTLSPKNAKAGQNGFIYIIQDASTARSLAFAASFVFIGGVDPTLTPSTSAKDILFYQVIDDTGPIIYASLAKNVS